MKQKSNVTVEPKEWAVFQFNTVNGNFHLLQDFDRREQAEERQRESTYNHLVSFVYQRVSPVKQEAVVSWDSDEDERRWKAQQQMQKQMQPV